MKKLTGFIIILAVLILGGYYGMGVLTERTIKKNVKVINQSNGLIINLEEYKRGWFRSNARIQWVLHVPERIITAADGKQQTVVAQDYQMNMPVVIHHGPFIFADKQPYFGMGYAKTLLTLPEQYKQKFNESFSKDSTMPQLELSIFINYLNQSVIELTLPSFKLVSKDGMGHFDWMGMNSTTTMPFDLSKVEGNILIDGLALSKEDTRITVGKVSSNVHLHRTETGLYLGDAKFSLPSLEAKVKEKTIFAVNGFTLSSDSDIQQKLFSTNLNVAVEALVVNDLAYGPGNIELSLRNLDAEVLAAINKQAATMQNGSGVERQKAMIALLPELPKLFNKGAEFAISKCTLKVPEGVIDGSLLLSLPKGDTVNPFELLQKVQGDAKLKMPKAVLKQLVQRSVIQQMAKQPELQQTLTQQLQTQQPANQPAATPQQLAEMHADKQIGTMEQNGLIIAKDSDYLIEMKLEQGKFTVNGKPFNSAMVK